MTRFPHRALLHVALAACSAWLAFASLPAEAEEALTLDIEGADAALVREAIEREVVQLVPAPRGRLSVRRHGAREVTVAFVSEEGRRLERSIVVQRGSSESAEEIALLAANLMRDDAGSLNSPNARPTPSTEGEELNPPTPSEVSAPSPPPPSPASPPVGAPSNGVSPGVAVGGARRMAPSSVADSAHDACSLPGPSFPFAFDVVPHVGTSSSSEARSATRNVALNLFGGWGAGLRGAEIGTLFNVETRFVCGAHVGGLLNVVTGPVQGFEMGGMVNATGPFQGAQLSGMVNVAGAFDGAQVAGILNVTTGSFAGAQVSGAVNVVRGTFEGAQLSGVVNVASGDVTGVQMSAVNVSGGRVRGVQVGIVNIAEKSDFSFGLVNVNTQGRTHLDLWSELEVGLLATAVKHGGDHWHSVYGIATRLTDPGFTGVLGVGGHVRFLDWLYMDIDVIAYLLPSLESSKQTSLLAQARAVLGFNIIDEFALYAGPSFNALAHASTATDWSPGYALNRDPDDATSVPLWPGITFGLQALAE